MAIMTWHPLDIILGIGIGMILSGLSILLKGRWR